MLKSFPEQAEEMFAAAKANARWRYNNYVRLSQQQWGADPLIGSLEKANENA